MIKNARVLEDDFLPQEIAHRDAEQTALTNALRPVTEGEQALPVFLFGPSGAGKTCLARHTTEKLREQTFDVDTHYVNCWQHYTRFTTLYEVLRGIGGTAGLNQQATPTSDLLDGLREHEDEYVVVLDEVDQLEDMRVLYDLREIPNLTMVLIANREEEVFARLEDRVQSRLKSAHRIQFSKYTDSELVTILKNRAKEGLLSEVIGTEEFEHIAELAAGDARVAINVLRKAARKADQQRSERISVSIIEEAAPEAREEIRERNEEKLTEDQTILYEVILEQETVSPGELYDEYTDRVSDPKSKRAIRNDLQKMARYGMIESTGKTRSRRYSTNK